MDCPVNPPDSFLHSEAAAEGYCDEFLDGKGNVQYLDKSGSVSALVEVEDDFDYDVKMLGPF